MNLRPLPLLGVLGAFLVPLFTTVAASAQPVVVAVVPAPADGARFRGGIGLEGGALVFAASGAAVKVGAIGLAGQLGAQINHNWGVYAVPTFDIVFGAGTGVSIGAGAMADYTFDGIPIGVAAGPEVGTIAAFGTSGAAAGVFYGARLRGAYYPIISRGDNGIRRRALYVALDLRMDLGTVGAAQVNGTVGTVTASDHAFLISPMVGFGYQAF